MIGTCMRTCRLDKVWGMLLPLLTAPSILHAAMSCNRTVPAGVSKARFIYSDFDFPVSAPVTGCNGATTGVW
jgi:hypothetical protein